MDSGSSPAEEGQNNNVDESTKEILVPHMLDPDPFLAENEIIEGK